MAFCISQLSFSEKCLRRLQDNFGCYQDKLSDTDVYSSLSSILQKAKKFSKPEVKVCICLSSPSLHLSCPLFSLFPPFLLFSYSFLGQVLVDELEAKMLEVHRKGLEEEEVVREGSGERAGEKNETTSQSTSEGIQSEQQDGGTDTSMLAPATPVPSGCISNQ